MKSILLTTLLLLSSILFAQPGTIDPTFGINGRVIMTGVEDGTLNVAYSTAIQPDGKIITAGAGYIGIQVFAVTRNLSNGSPDPSFSDDGIAFITTMPRSSDTHSEAYGVAIAPDGKIIVVGETVDFVNRVPEYYSIVVRLNSDGSLDPTFNGDGVARLKLSNQFVSERLWGVAVQPDGKILACGTSRNLEFSEYQTMTLVRLNTDGNLDNSFGVGGIARIDATHISNGTRLVIHSNGMITAVGNMYSFENEEYDGLVVRFDQNGSPDNNFDNDGYRLIDIGADNFLEDVVTENNGHITVVGSGNVAGTVNSDFHIARLLNNGLPDNSFDSDGYKVIDQSQEDFAHAVDLDSKNRLLLTGTTYEFSSATNSFTNFIKVIRIFPNGNIDAAFAGDGSYEDDFGNNAFGYDAVLQADGKLIVAGSAHDGENNGRALTRIRTKDCDYPITGTFKPVRALPIGVSNNTLYLGFQPASNAILEFLPDGSNYQYAWSSSNTNASFTLHSSNAAAINIQAQHQGNTDFSVRLSDENGCSATFSKTINIRDVRCGADMKKVLVCLSSDRYPSRSLTVCINQYLVPLALFVGGELGACEPQIQTLTNNRKSISTHESFKILNNPTKTTFTLQHNGLNGDVQVRVIDAVGRPLERFILNGSGTLSFGANYRPGFYVAIIDAGNNSTVFKLVKN